MISCAKSDEKNTPGDQENPQMSISAPIEKTVIYKGEEILLTGTFTDDVDLKELVITLISPSTAKSTFGIENPWEPESEIIELSGMKQDINAKVLFDETVPVDCTSGAYIVSILLKDASGKETINNIEIEII